MNRKTLRIYQNPDGVQYNISMYKYDHVTANKRANKMEIGKRPKIINANPIDPKAAAQAAFINMTANTPAFTEPRIFFALGQTSYFRSFYKNKPYFRGIFLTILHGHIENLYFLAYIRELICLYI